MFEFLKRNKSTITVSPDTVKESTNKRIFLAGGISNCPDWQSYVADELKKKVKNLDIINPRRTVWDDERKDSSVSLDQIVWEKEYLDECDYVLFWFPKNTLCPITLFELGAALYTKNITSIGIEPGYQREFDVITQVGLVDKGIKITNSLDSMISQTVESINFQNKINTLTVDIKPATKSKPPMIITKPAFIK